MSSIKQYWYKLPARDQKVLSIGVVLVIAILLYSFIWAPLQDQLKRQRPQLAKQTADLQWVQSQAESIKRLQKTNSGSKATSDAPLLTVIDETARKFKLRDQIKQIQPGKENDTAKIWFDKVVFDEWLQWLDIITASGIDVTRVSVTKSALLSRVNIRLEVSQ